MLSRLVDWSLMVAVAVLVAIQFVPYGRAHTNPPLRQEPVWDSPTTRALAARACFDCHSNETVWPWYAHVAPLSWLVQNDVDEGRASLNFSEWDRPQDEAREAVETVREGSMPPWRYPWARLSPDERRALLRGLAATLGGDGRGEGEERRDDKD